MHRITKLFTHTILLTMLLVVSAVPHTATAMDAPYPSPHHVGNANTLGHGIQRTMHLLASSTPECRNTTRILFYGQSITEQDWWRQVAEDLRTRFPLANLMIENRAIGGHSSQRLVKTAEADLYPFYPDLVIFHVYGSHTEYDNIIRSIREQTTAEILLLNDHVTRDADLTEETDPEKLTPQNWDAFMNHKFLPQTALKYGAEFVDQRSPWKRYLKDNQLSASDLLKDGVHLNAHGCFLMAELVKPYLRLDPTARDEAWRKTVTTFTVGRDMTWTEDRLELDFAGNRIDAIAASSVNHDDPLEVWIDGKRPSEIPELRTFNRVSAFPNSSWPCLLRVQSLAPLLIEDWTVTLTEVSDDLKTVTFTLAGSKTGNDGEGTSTNRFVSQSQRIAIDPEDWNLGYCAQVFNRSLEPGHTITWKVLPLYKDTFIPTSLNHSAKENSVTLAQGLTPGMHRLTLRGKSAANLAALRVHSPPAMRQPLFLFVSPQGNDGNGGTREQPFATFQRAQQAVRHERRTNSGRGVTVTFLPGRYELSAPLKFTAQDSGSLSTEPVVYRAGAGGEVEISGGSRIQGWQPDRVRAGVWKTHIKDKAWRFEQLWVNNKRAIRARTPNWWEFNTLLGVTETPLTGQDGRFTHTFAVQPKILSSLSTLDEAALRDTQVLVYHKWDTTREWLQSISPETGTFVTHGGKMKSWNPMARDCLFLFENALFALDAPGEWFLDRDGWLYYKPRAGEDMVHAQVVAPRIDRFMTIAGIPDRPESWVKHLHFEGLKFRHADFHIPAEGLPPTQAVMNVEAAAIQVDAAKYIQFRDCAVEHIGSTAFWFRHACRDCRVERTRMFDLGVTGVRIGETKIVSEAEITGAITIDNCIIQSGGRIGPSAVGVWIGHSPENAITHCDISDFFYTAVSVGWRWGYETSAARKNRIEFNHLHHIGYRILSDMGGVYTLGPSQGTRVCHNVIHDVYSTRYGGWGLYPDEGSTGILFENNLVYDVRDGCVHQHYGKENIFRNNILAFSEEGQVAVTRAEPHLSFTFENNIVVWDEGTLLGYGGWKSGAKVDLRNNLYWRLGGEPFDFAGQTFEQWQAAGKDQGSLIADPMFVDVEKRNFALSATSPASKIGFKPFDADQAGVYGSEDWKQLAASLSYPEPYVVPAPEPLTMQEDFEGGAITPLMNISTLNQEGRQDLIRVVSDGTGSNHCLRVQDHPDLKAGYNPHFYWDPQYREGPAHLAFRIRLDAQANISCEWRDRNNPYRTGPSLQFHGRGIYTRGRRLMDLSENQWLDIDMHTVLGQNNSTWTLSITGANSVCHTFKDLACDPLWKEARWVGFSSSSPGQVSFYLDNVVMEN